MKHIKLFEEFCKLVQEEIKSVLKEGVGDTIIIVKAKSKYLKGDFSKFKGDEGKIIEYPFSDKAVNVIMTTGAMEGSTMLFPTDIIQIKKVIEADGFEIRESVNEDAGLIADVAIGVAVGIAGLWALVQGLPVVGNVLGDAAEVIANKAEAKAKLAAKGQRRELIEEIIKKFDGDTRLAQMYQDLPPYKANAHSARARQLSTIGKYIKARLTPEEMKYFTDVSSMLRTGDIY
jgi:hypothetical protein